MSASELMHLEPWHPFLATVATAAAALMGLLFLGMSMHLQVLTAPRNAELRYVARATFMAYVGPFIASLLALVPQDAPLLGTELLVWSALLAAAAVAVTRLRRSTEATAVSRQRRLYLVDLAVGWTLIGARFIAALGFIAEQPWAIGLLAAVLVLALGYAINNSWELVFRAAQATREPSAPDAL